MAYLKISITASSATSPHYYPDSPGQIIPLLPPGTNSVALTQASGAPRSSKASSSSKHFIMQPEKKVPSSQATCAWPRNHLAHESWFPNLHHKSSFQYLFLLPPANFKIPRNSLNYKASLYSSGKEFILGFICMILKCMTNPINNLEGKINGSNYLPWHRSNQWNIVNR